MIDFLDWLYIVIVFVPVAVSWSLSSSSRQWRVALLFAGGTAAANANNDETGQALLSNVKRK